MAKKKPEIFIRLEYEDKEKIKAAAKAERLPVSTWARLKLIALAERSLK